MNLQYVTFSSVHVPALNWQVEIAKGWAWRGGGVVGRKRLYKQKYCEHNCHQRHVDKPTPGMELSDGL